MLVAAGIEASRAEDKSGTKITLRKMSTVVATNATGAENPTRKADGGGNTNADAATANATSTANATRKPADRTESGISGNSGSRFGDFSEEASTPEQAGRIRKLVEEGMKEKWAREAVLGKGRVGA